MSPIVPLSGTIVPISEPIVPKPHIPSLVEIEAMEREMFQGTMNGVPIQRIDCPPVHRFAPGAYMREITMPKGAFIIGQRHRTEHLNIVLTGRCSVLCGDDIMEITAPFTFISKPGVRKALYIHETCTWATIHPTDETDLAKLEEMLVEKSETYLEFKEIEAMKALVSPAIKS